MMPMDERLQLDMMAFAISPGVIDTNAIGNPLPNDIIQSRRWDDRGN